MCVGEDRKSSGKCGEIRPPKLGILVEEEVTLGTVQMKSIFFLRDF